MEEAEKYIRIHLLFSLVKYLMCCFSSFHFASILSVSRVLNF